MWQQVLNSLQSSECYSVYFTVSSLIHFNQSHHWVCTRRYRCPFFTLSDSAVSTLLYFNTLVTADTSGMGESENLCSRNHCSTLQRSVVPGLDSFGRLNYYFLALLNLLQLSGWICCDCILLPHLLWHNSHFLSIHCYFPILAHIVTNRWTNQVNLKSKFTVAENKSMHI